MKIPSLDFHKGKLSVKSAESTYDKEKNRKDKTTQHSSNIITSGGLSLDSGKNITIAGSNIDAGGDISLSAKENVNIITTQETTKTSNEETHGSIELSLGVKHQATEIYYAADALINAIKKLKDAKNAYEKYKDDLKKSEQDYANRIIDKEDYEDLKDDREYYITSIALLTVNVVSKTKNMAKTTAATGSSASTFGFNIDAQMDIDALEEKTLAIMTGAKTSDIKTNSSLIITAGNNALIKGSDITARDTIKIAGDNLDITAARNTYEKSYDSKHAHITTTHALHGGLSVDASADTTVGITKSSSYVNTHLNASDIKITSKNDTSIQGAAVTASKDLTLDAGNNLIIRSLQNRSEEKEHTIGVSAGYSGGSQPAGSKKTDPKGNAGINFSITNGKSKWVAEQTRLIGGGNVNVKVSGKTELKGAVIASATDKLSFDTGSFTYSDIRDKDKSSTLGGGLSWSKEYGTKSNGQAKESEYGFDAEYGFKDKRQLNRAVIGTGAIIIRDNPNQDIASLKRDVTFAQIGTKNTGVSLEFDSEILDVVLNPVKTYNDIKNNSIRSGKIIETVADGITKAISEEEKGNAVKWTNVGNYIYDSFAYRHASRDFVEENPEIASIMSDPNATPVQKQFAQQLHLNYISDQLGIPIGKLSIYNSDLPGPAGESAGMFVKETGDIYLNTGIYAEEETLSTTLGHEVSHAIDQTNARDYGEDYADLMGTNLNDSLNMEFGLANLPEIKNNVRTNEEWREQYKNDSLIINNNKAAESLGYGDVEQDFIFSIDRISAGGHGHMTGYFQDEKGNWYKFDKYIAPDEKPSTLGLLLNKEYSSLVEISHYDLNNIFNLKQDKKNNIYIETTKEQDKKITQKAFELKNDKNGKYRLHTDNCADSVQDIAKEGGIKTPWDVDPRPNTIFDNIEKMYNDENN